MKFKDFRKTDTYIRANVVYFTDTDGENCEDIAEVMDDMEVINVYSKNGYLEIVLENTKEVDHMEDMSIQLTLTAEEIAQLAKCTGMVIENKEDLHSAVLMAIEKYVETYKGGELQTYQVRYEDNFSDTDSVSMFATEELAEQAIEEDLAMLKEAYEGSDYDYADCGNKTEFWVKDSHEYASWERLWL